MEKNKILFSAFAVVVVGAVFAGGVSVGMRVRPDIGKITELINKEDGIPVGDPIDFDPFWKTWNIINEKYVATKSPDSQEKMWGAIAGLARSLGDPYTSFLTPEELEAFSEDLSGNFEGVGMEIGMKNNILTVVAPLKGTPAERAGIRAGDRVIQIDDTVTMDMSLEEAVRHIRGERGTQVTLTILREGKDAPLEITILREVITIPTLEVESRPGEIVGDGETGVGRLKEGIFIIKLFNFMGGASEQFRDALREFTRSGTHKLIIDLRNNPGGFLETSVEIASWFLPPGKIVVQEEVAGGERGDIFRSKGYDIFNENLRLVILVNGGSASASEILAGALKEHGKATIVGEKTFGKGSVQELVGITDDTSLKITIARWLTPNGNSISDGGLTPDVEVALTPEDVEKDRDPQLDKAIEILNRE